jgi:hypothetical protein
MEIIPLYETEWVVASGTQGPKFEIPIFSKASIKRISRKYVKFLAPIFVVLALCKMKPESYNSVYKMLL